MENRVHSVSALLLPYAHCYGWGLVLRTWWSQSSWAGLVAAIAVAYQDMEVRACVQPETGGLRCYIHIDNYFFNLWWNGEQSTKMSGSITIKEKSGFTTSRFLNRIKELLNLGRQSIYL